jgi:predicted ATPase
VEDIHWIDNSSAALLESIFKLQVEPGACRFKIMLVTSTRPNQIQGGFNPSKLTVAQSAQVSLERFTVSECREFVSQELSRDLGLNISQIMYELSGGLPLFLQRLLAVLKTSIRMDNPDEELDPEEARIISICPSSSAILSSLCVLVTGSGALVFEQVAAQRVCESDRRPCA